MKTIHHVVDIDAPEAVVWRSLTEQDQLAGWWSTRVESPPAAVGARAVWTFAGDFNPVMETVHLDDRRRKAVPSATVGAGRSWVPVVAT